MKKLLFLFTMLVFFVACSDDDKDNESPIKGLEIPKFENPIKPGESVTIKGEGFTQASEIWFRTIITRAENTRDVKAIVTEVNSTGITFTAPEVYGNQSILLKENGKEYEIGKMTFEEQPEEGGDIEILPKRIKKVVFHEDEKDSETYEYAYNGENKITSVKVTIHYDNRTENMTYTYAADKITVKTTGGEDEEEFVFNLENGKLSNSKLTYTDMDELFIDNFVYTYAGEYLSKVVGSEETEDEKISETFSFIQGKLVKYTHDSPNYGYSDTQEFAYGSQLNNLNIDLFAFVAYNFESESVDEAFLLEIVGKRSQHLPSSMKWTTVDKEDGTETTEHAFTYKMNGDYITEIIITEKMGKEAEWRFEIFYED